MGLAIKTAYSTKDNSQKQLKTAHPNNPWAYFREGLLLEGYNVTASEIWGLIVISAYIWADLSEFYSIFLLRRALICLISIFSRKCTVQYYCKQLCFLTIGQ